MPMLIDHLFVAVFCVLVPLHGWMYYRKLQAQLANGEPVNRIELYGWTIGGQWLLGLAAVVIWAVYQRPWSTLGYGLETDRLFWLAVLITAAIIGYAVYTSLRTHTLSPEVRARFRETVERLQLQSLMPADRRELRWFYALSITAGVVEEMLWRGFMWWYLCHWLPEWAAALVAIAAFGFIHIYQGVEGMLRTGLMGAALLGLYLLSGSLWLPMLVHAAVDIFQGKLLYGVLRQDEGSGPEAGSTAESDQAPA